MHACWYKRGWVGMQIVTDGSIEGIQKFIVNCENGNLMYCEEMSTFMNGAAGGKYNKTGGNDMGLYLTAYDGVRARCLLLLRVELRYLAKLELHDAPRTHGRFTAARMIVVREAALSRQRSGVHVVSHRPK
jgi:hypothetical protein